MYVGQAIRRREDERFLRGRGHYVEDVTLDQPIAHAAFVRSPHAHAAVTGIDTAQAEAMPGVLAVLTGAGLERRRLWRGGGRLAGQGQERRGCAHRQPALHLCRRDGPLRRRDHCHGRRRGPPPGARCPPRPSGSITRRSRPTPSPPGRSIPIPRWCTPRMAPTKCWSPSMGLREETEAALASAHHVTGGRGPHQPGHRRLDRAALLHGPLRHGQRPLHGVDHQPGAAHRPPLLHQVARHPRAQAARDRAPMWAAASA